VTAETILIIAAIVAVVAVVGSYAYRRRGSGPLPSLEQEEERSDHLVPDRASARVDHFEIRPLGRAMHHRFSEEWASVQAMFVDDPNKAVEQADDLAAEVMRARGYPVGDFEQRAADVSVQHPTVAEHYREAHAIATAQRGDRGDGDPAALRRAFVHYRALFGDLLASPAHGRGKRTVTRTV
jgi:hypothetical protein